MLKPVCFDVEIPDNGQITVGDIFDNSTLKINVSGKTPAKNRDKDANGAPVKEAYFGSVYADKHVIAILLFHEDLFADQLNMRDFRHIDDIAISNTLAVGVNEEKMRKFFADKAEAIGEIAVDEGKGFMLHTREGGLARVSAMGTEAYLITMGDMRYAGRVFSYGGKTKK